MSECVRGADGRREGAYPTDEGRLAFGTFERSFLRMTAFMPGSVLAATERPRTILALVLLLRSICDFSRRGVGARRSSGNFGCHGAAAGNCAGRRRSQVLRSRTSLSLESNERNIGSVRRSHAGLLQNAQSRWPSRGEGFRLR